MKFYMIPKRNGIKLVNINFRVKILLLLLIGFGLLQPDLTYAVQIVEIMYDPFKLDKV